MSNTQEDSALGLNDLMRIVQRHRGRAAVVFAAISLLSVFALWVLPRTYQSEVLLFVRVGRESVTLDPTVTTGKIIALNESRESELNSILEVLRCRSMMEKVVDELGPEMVLEGPAGEGGGGSVFRTLASAASGAVGWAKSMVIPSDPISPREKAVQSLLRSVYITNPHRSNVISITARGKSPEQAQIIAQAISDGYLVEHRQINKTEGSYDFFVNQSEMFAEKLSEASDALRVAKSETDIASVEGKRKLIETRIQKLEMDRQTAEAALSASRAKIASLEAAVAALPERVHTQKVEGMPNVAGDSMRQMLYQLEIKEKELLSKYTEEHPKVIAVREQVRNAQRIQDGQASSRTTSTTMLNPSLQKLEQDLLTERALADSLVAQRDELGRQHKLALADLHKLNDDEQRIVALERDVTLAKTRYLAYAEKLEEARIQDSLDEQKIMNVNVPQPASFVEKAIGPKPGLILAAGLVAACCGALAVAIWSEVRSPKLRSREDVEALLGVPVVVSIPAVPRDRVLVN